MKRTLFNENDFAELSPIFRGKRGLLLAKIAMQILALNRINKVFSKICHLRNGFFTEAWLKELDIKYEVENKELLDSLPEGAFVTVSNHPFGFIDGIILVDIFSSIRRDYKFMVNSILLKLYPVEDMMVGVKPTTTRSGSSIENTTGLKVTLRHLRDGCPVGFFPAGAVSNYNECRFRVTDREWQATVVRIIQMAKVPVVPVFIHGKNSLFFNFLGRINWQLRSVRLSREILNKHKRTIKVTIGQPILWQDQSRFHKTEDLAAFLRAKTYELSING